MVALAAAVPVSADDFAYGTIAGTVYRSDTNAPLAGIYVSCWYGSSLRWTTVTDEYGDYSYTTLADTYGFSVQAEDGFYSIYVDNIEILPDETTEQNFTLTPYAVPEPSAMLVMLFGGCGICGMLLKRRTR